jgi:hypothetical protein
MGQKAAAQPRSGPPPPPEAPLTVFEVRAPAGRSCRQLLFAAAALEQRPVPLDGGGFAATRLDPALCGLAIRARDPRTMSVEVSPALIAASLPVSRQRDGSQLLFLRDHLRQNVVYTLQVFAEDGARRRPLGSFRHELIP